MAKVTVGTREFELGLSEEQSGYLEGFALAARFVGQKALIDGKEPTYESVSEIKSTEFGFFEGWRFALARAGKFRTYYSLDPYVWKGSQAYLEKDPSAILTDIYSFDMVHEGGVPLKLKYPEKVLTLVIDESKSSDTSASTGITYTLYYSPEKWRLFLNGEGIMDIDPALPGTEFLDSLRDDISDTLYMFMTKAFLSGLIGLPDRVKAKVIPDGLQLMNESYKRLITPEYLSSKIMADYLSSVL